jgi:hypothetical protein
MAWHNTTPVHFLSPTRIVHAPVRLAGVVDRAIGSVSDMLQLLVSGKSNPDPKTVKGVFTTTISFLPNGGYLI